MQTVTLILLILALCLTAFILLLFKRNSDLSISELIDIMTKRHIPPRPEMRNHDSFLIGDTLDFRSFRKGPRMSQEVAKDIMEKIKKVGIDKCLMESDDYIDIIDLEFKIRKRDYSTAKREILDYLQCVSEGLTKVS